MTVDIYEYLHFYLPLSFGMTEGYFVFLEQPIYISLSRLFINKFRGNPLANDLFIFDYDEKVNVGHV